LADVITKVLFHLTLFKTY